MRVAYLTWGETPRSYGVFGSQVIGQFVETAKLNPNDQFHFISAVPIIHSGLVREKWGYVKELNAVKAKLGSIQFHWLPIWVSQNFVYSSQRTFGLMHGIAHLHLKTKLLKVNPDIVHCRSYGAAWAALSVKEKYGLRYKIIFDGRGLWPEEAALKKGWSEKSADYLFLKSIESKLLEYCDCSVTVSDTMHEHYVGLGAKNDHTIYLSADTNQLKVGVDQFEFNDNVRFCYVGALSNDTWHQPSALVDLYRQLRALFPKTQLTIVTTSNHDSLRRDFAEFPENEIVLTATKTRAELKQVLESQDFGLMTYFQPKNDKEILLGRMVLAVKSAEYFIAGLPMICNAYCGGVARLIEKNQLGITYFPEKLEEIKREDINSYLNKAAKNRCQDFAEENFDYGVNALNYKNIYESLIAEK
jgi:glycosyltransferase involved in cell wall biosynthesis